METGMEVGLDEESRSTIRMERRRSLNQTAVERRRRIVERGTDRLDLITGKIRALSVSSSFHLQHPHSSPPPLSPHHSGEAADPMNDETTQPSTLANQDSSSPDHSTRGDAVEMDRATLQNPSVEDRPNTQPLPAMPIVQEAATDEKPVGGSCQSRRPKLFSHKQIIYCILASEKIRACCSLIIALLVVLSYIDDPLFGMDIVDSESVIALRPLYMLLLTDVTIVLARLVLQKQRNLEVPPEQERSEGQDDGNIWMDAVHLLESGLVVYRIMRGLFIDCSIYLVVVVCGVSLV